MRRHVILFAALLLAACATEQRAPLPPPAAAPTQPANVYVVAPGDTIYSVSRRLNVPVRALIDANRLQAPYMLTPGQRLVLPGAGLYVVAKGDSLSKIARKTGVPFATLARTNGLAAPYTLQIGQRLMLPSAVEMPAEAPAAAAQTAVAPLPPPQGTAPAETQAAPPAQTAAATLPPAALPPPAPKSGHGFLWPVKGEVIAEFGTAGHGQHNDGINIAAARGTPVIAAESGVVAYAGNEIRGFGNLLLIKHANGWMTAYAHNDTLLMKKGDVVKRGQRIAKVGDSGGVTQPQLHFEIRQGTRAVDPATLLGAAAIPVTAPAESGGPG